MGFNNLGENGEGGGSRGVKISVLAPVLLALMANISCISVPTAQKARSVVDPTLISNSTGKIQVPKSKPNLKTKLNDFSIEEIKEMPPEDLAKFSVSDFYSISPEKALAISDNFAQFRALSIGKRGGVLNRMGSGK